MNYTETYGLPQWEKSDRIMMEDFNQAMGRIDKGIQDAAELPYALGGYTGTGEEAFEVFVGFRPRYVIVCADQADSFLKNCVGRFVAITNQIPTHNKAAITDTGFWVGPYQEDILFPRLNERNVLYNFIAFR